MNFGPRGPFSSGVPGANSPSGRFRNMYQQSPPPNMGQPRGIYHPKDRPVTFMPNETIKIPKPPKQPDKPLPAYMRYSRKVWEKVKSQHPEMKMWDIGKVIGEQWRNLPEDERQGYFAEYEVEKSEYQEAMKAYHNSTAYRDWLKAKEKAQQAMQEQQIMEKMIGQQIPKEEPRFQLQQVEDDDEDAEFAVKHIAAARFQRNHRLIAEIFSEAIVPDSKTIVTKPRLENLKRQVQSLMQHQRKLESEIHEMEEKFEAKKRKILQNSGDFEVKMKELAEIPPPPVISPTKEQKEENRDEEILNDNTKSCTETVNEEKMETEDSKKTTTTMEALPVVNIPDSQSSLTSIVSTEITPITSKEELAEESKQSSPTQDEKKLIPSIDCGEKKDAPKIIHEEKTLPNSESKTGKTDEDKLVEKLNVKDEQEKETSDKSET